MIFHSTHPDVDPSLSFFSHDTGKVYTLDEIERIQGVKGGGN
jgi:hypothetical protein